MNRAIRTVLAVALLLVMLLLLRPFGVVRDSACPTPVGPESEYAIEVRPGLFCYIGHEPGLQP